MKKKVLSIILIISTLAVFAQENDIQIFWIEIEKLIETASTTELELETRLSEGASFYKHSCEKCDIFELYLFSSVGKTKYFCIKQQNIWQIKKTAIYYNVPYNLDNNATSETEYFQYNGELFLYNLENNKLEKSELNHLPAVVDVKNVDFLMELLSNNL